MAKQKTSNIEQIPTADLIPTRNAGIVRVSVSDIEDHPQNYRTHPQSQREALSATIKEIGWYGYPDVYKTESGTYRLIDGHLRKSMLREKYGEFAAIEVNVTNMTEAEAKKALLTHDPLSAMAEIDAVVLESLLAETEFDSAALRCLADDLELSAVHEVGDETQEGDSVLSNDVNIEDMELRPEEHYDFIMVMADNVNDWNRLVSLFDLPHVKLSRTHRRIGLARAVRASTVLEMIDANLQDSDSDTRPTAKHAVDAQAVP
jgi:hypothetical protein